MQCYVLKGGARTILIRLCRAAKPARPRREPQTEHGRHLIPLLLTNFKLTTVGLSPVASQQAHNTPALEYTSQCRLLSVNSSSNPPPTSLYSPSTQQL